jgi:hypothetical protein
MQGISPIQPLFAKFCLENICEFSRLRDEFLLRDVAGNYFVAAGNQFRLLDRSREFSQNRSVRPDTSKAIAITTRSRSAISPSSRRESNMPAATLGMSRSASLTCMLRRLAGSPKGLFRQILSTRAARESDLFRGRMATLEDVLDILVAQAGPRDLDTELKRERERPWISSSIRFTDSVAGKNVSKPAGAASQRADFETCFRSHPRSEGRLVRLDIGEAA